MPADPALSMHPDSRPVAAIFRSPNFNASETFVQAHALALRRFQPLIVGLERTGPADPALEGRVLLPRSAAERALIRLTGNAAPLAERVGERRPRLVHAHFATDGLIALPLAQALGVPLVTTLHGYDVTRTRGALLGSLRLSWMRYAVRRGRLTAGGDLFLAVSDAIRRRAIAQGFPPERLVTHYL
jgi:glycosyltransferase involved in cell wall biosynthesis